MKEKLAFFAFYIGNPRFTEAILVFDSQRLLQEHHIASYPHASFCLCNVFGPDFCLERAQKRQFFDDFLTDFWVVSNGFPNIMLGFLGTRRLEALKT